MNSRELEEFQAMRNQCNAMQRGNAALARQMQDNNGGPQNQAERMQRREFNKQIHCKDVINDPNNPYSKCPNARR